MSLKYYLLPAFFLFNSFNAYTQDDNIFGLQNSLKYADYLIKSHNYKEAIPEIERLIYLVPNDTSLKIQLINTYLRQQDYNSAIKKTRLFYPSINEMPLNFAKCYGKALLLNRSDSIASFVKENNYLPDSLKTNYLIAFDLLNKKWVLAKKISGTSTPYYLNNILQQTDHIEYKSPGLALALSAIIPGAGKIYTKNWKDGLIALVTVGLFSFESYMGFSRKGIGSAYGWISGGLAGGFYAGNLYGSYRSAVLYNNKLDNKIIHETEEAITTHF